MAAADAAIKAFLHPHLYRHPDLMKVRADAGAIVRDLFERLTAEPAAMPEEWRANLTAGDEARLARRVSDFIAGMTDRTRCRSIGAYSDNA
jgi:dGTPase